MHIAFLVSGLLQARVLASRQIGAGLFWRKFSRDCDFWRMEEGEFVYWVLVVLRLGLTYAAYIFTNLLAPLFIFAQLRSEGKRRKEPFQKR